MVKIKKNLDVLKEIVKIIKNINEEMVFTFCKEGVVVKAIDTSSISMGIFRIKKDMFEEYDVEEEIICTFQVDIILKILKKIGKKELSISFEEDKVNFVSSTDKFSLKFFVGKEDERPEPEYECVSEWNINTKDFFTNIKEFGDFNEIIKIHSVCEKLYLGTKSKILEGQSVTNSIHISDSVDSLCWYSLSHFKMIYPIQKIFNEVKLEFGSESPCMITAENDNLKFKWVLAPRVEE